jgi:hypothetical protein
LKAWQGTGREARKPSIAFWHRPIVAKYQFVN